MPSQLLGQIMSYIATVGIYPLAITAVLMILKIYAGTHPKPTQAQLDAFEAGRACVSEGRASRESLKSS